MAKHGNITFTGKSTTEYIFTIYSFDASFKAVGAVYFITNRHKDNNDGHSHTTIYVGETEDLSTRFDNHHKQVCFNKYNANCICTLAIGSESRRLKIEKDLIDNYNPPCNG